MMPKVLIKHGPSENIFRLELYTALRDLVPVDWYCSPEVHEPTESKKRLDLLVAELLPQLDPQEKESYRNWTGYELKVDKVSHKDFKDPRNSAWVTQAGQSERRNADAAATYDEKLNLEPEQP
ncbi:hypothetical protein VTN77DRAFT_1605 [Rasamsonia byssochlamydoides]|uniref:uncharacterized protein n=1 Tax=Rasamsonia byssochlamydoides TaxID=89139 RepID=UPI003743CB4E